MTVKSSLRSLWLRFSAALMKFLIRVDAGSSLQVFARRPNKSIIKTAFKGEKYRYSSHYSAFFHHQSEEYIILQIVVAGTERLTKIKTFCFIQRETFVQFSNQKQYAILFNLKTLSQTKFLLLSQFLANYFHISVLPCTLPQFDWTTANILPCILN